MQNNSLATAKRSARLARYWRPIGKLAATSAVLVGAVAWTSTLDTPLRHRTSDEPTVVQALVSRPVAPAPTLPVSDEARGIARLLQRRTSDSSLAQRIANALVVEGEKRHVKPTLLVGMLLTENDRLNPTAKSNVGATGLMQVMPFHAGKYGCESPRLDDVEGNICHGVTIISDLIKRSPNVTKALLRYNGCVRGSNTPHCQTYSTKVLTRTRAAEKALATLATNDAATAPMIR